VTFLSKDGAKVALGLSGKDFRVTSRENSSIDVDADFLGLTTVHESTHTPNLEYVSQICQAIQLLTHFSIVAIHGLNGHAWNSWTKHENGRETNWLRDYLPRVLEDKGIFPRIMVFGYNVNVLVNKAVVDVTVPSANLVVELQSERGNVGLRFVSV